MAPWFAIQPVNFAKRGLEEEKELVERIHVRFLCQKLFCPLTIIQALAVQIHWESQKNTCGEEPGPRQKGRQDLNETVTRKVPRHEDEFLPSAEANRPPFKGSRRWGQNFMKWNGFSGRKLQAKRRATVEPGDIEGFRVRIRFILSQYPPDRVINVDETSWKLINAGFVTLAKTGIEIVEYLLDGDTALCLPAIAAIDAAGVRLLTWIFSRGNTERCERRYRADETLDRAVRRGEWMVSHEENGWTAAQVACDYFHRI
jgi:hypothetical protein